MSLSPVSGTEVPETANGVATPVALENGPQVPVSVKCSSRLPGPGEASVDGSLAHTENHAVVENRVYDVRDHVDTDMDINGRTSSLSLESPQVAEPPLPAVTGTEDLEPGSKDTDIPEASKIVDPTDAILLWDSALHRQSKDSCQRGGPVTVDRAQTDAETADGGCDGREEEEEEDGEREKQDVEEDEKNENKLETQHAGRRTEVEVGLLF